jgi:uncharacterized protein
MSGHPAFQSLDLIGFLMLGLIGGFGHCVGMCSPFVLFVSRRYDEGGAGARGGRRAGAIAQAWYHAGRVSVYVALGALAGALAGVVQKAGAFIGLQRAAMVVAGGVLVVWALAALLGLARLEAGGGLFTRVAGLLKRRVPGHPLAMGLLLGLLPCGFLYSAVVAAVARGTALEGALAMALFGLGTAPALLGVSFADELLGARRRALLNRLAQLFILAMGARFLWRGL